MADGLQPARSDRAAHSFVANQIISNLVNISGRHIHRLFMILWFASSVTLVMVRLLLLSQRLMERQMNVIKRGLVYLEVVGIGILMLMFGTWMGVLHHDEKTEREIVRETVVVAEPSDPYYSLAQEIALEEGIDIVDDLAEGLKLSPKYVILVASPQSLTRTRLFDVGHILVNTDSYPAVGIISGSTLEKAEQLWQRRHLARSGNDYYVSDADTDQTNQLLRAPTIFNISEGSDESIELNKSNLIETLQKADYVVYNRHLSGDSWSWNAESDNWGEDDRLIAEDVPPLKPVVVNGVGCGSLRPWLKESIALSFVDHGAASYLGHIDTGIAEASVGQGLFMPGVLSWQDFPLGLVAQVQSQMEMKVGFLIPNYLMLGDPRIYQSKDQPYRIISDTIDRNGKRTITGESTHSGVLPVKIEDGARYHYLALKGITAAGEDDLFHNNRLHTLDLGGDKYILFFHTVGSFRIDLSPQPPFGWTWTDALADAFDNSWVVLWINTWVVNSPIALGLVVIFIAILLFKVLKQRKSLRDYRSVFLVGIGLTLLRLIYLLMRWDAVSTTSSTIHYSPLQVALGCLGVFASVSGGLILMKDTRRMPVRVLGLLFAVLPQFFLTGLYLVTTILLNSPSRLLNYNIFWLAFTVLVLEALFVLAAYRFAVKRLAPSHT